MPVTRDFNIALPRSARPKYRCNICGTHFFEDEEQDWLRHLRRCAKINRERIEHEAKEALKEVIPVFDQEAFDFLKEHGSFKRKPGSRKP